MAVVSDPFNTLGSGGQETEQGSSSGSTPQGSTTSIPTQGKSPQITQAAAPTSSSSGMNLPNLQKYMTANSAYNQAGGGLAGTVAGNVNATTAQGQTNLQGAQNTMAGAQQAFAANQGADQASLNAFTQAPANASATDTQNVTNLVNDNYSGPNSFSDLTGNQNLTNLNMQATNAAQQAGETQNAAGQADLLKQAFGSPTYTSGQLNLDQYLMGAAPGAQAALNQANRNALGFQQQVGAGEQQATQQAANANQTAAINKQAALGALNTAVGTANTNVNTELAAAPASQQAALTQAILDAQNNTITPADQTVLTQAGFTPAGQYNYGIDPTKYLSMNNVAETAQQAATPQDYATFAALSQVLGGNANVPASATLQAFQTQPTTAYNPYAFNSLGYTGALQQAQTGWNTAASTVLNNIIQKNASEDPKSVGAAVFAQNPDLMDLITTATQNPTPRNVQAVVQALTTAESQWYPVDNGGQPYWVTPEGATEELAPFVVPLTGLVTSANTTPISAESSHSTPQITLPALSSMAKLR